MLLLNRKSGWEHSISRRFFLDKPYTGPDEENVPIYKFGATNDVRELWFDSCDYFYRNDKELEAKIQQANLSESILTVKKPQYKRTRKDVSCVCFKQSNPKPLFHILLRRTESWTSGFLCHNNLIHLQDCQHSIDGETQGILLCGVQIHNRLVLVLHLADAISLIIIFPSIRYLNVHTIPAVQILCVLLHQLAHHARGVQTCIFRQRGRHHLQRLCKLPLTAGATPTFFTAY